MVENPIDIVVIWVDGNDPKWYKEFVKYNPKVVDTSNSSSRFRDFGTLKYVFRSIEKFLPWVRKVHFITYGHKPEWLDINHPKVNFLTHNDIYYDKNHLPVFNSSSIELNFLGIKDLADKFIYFNDDMIVVNETAEERFFKNDLPVDFLIQGIPRRGWLYDKIASKSLWVKAINNNLDTINEKFDKRRMVKANKEKYYSKNYGYKNIMKNLISNIFNQYLHFEHYHHPQPYLKSTLVEVFNENREKILLTSSKKFRSETDLTQYIYRYWQLVKGEFEPLYAGDFKTFTISSQETAKECVEELDNYNFICLNDSPELSEMEYDNVQKIILDKLNQVFPDKSSFEK